MRIGVKLESKSLVLFNILFNSSKASLNFDYVVPLRTFFATSDIKQQTEQTHPGVANRAGR